MINTEQKFTPVRAVGGHCGTGAVMNILNYFWGTTFGVKDTFDIETFIQFGHFDWNRRPSESEIGYFLCKMNFKIEEFVKVEKGDREVFLKNPKAHQKKYGYTYYPLVNIDEHIKKLKLLNNHKNYSLTEGVDVDIRKIILAETSPNGELVYKDFEEVLKAMELYEFVMVISLFN